MSERMRVICTKAEMSAPDGYSLFHFEYPQGEYNDTVVWNMRLRAKSDAYVTGKTYELAVSAVM